MLYFEFSAVAVILSAIALIAIAIRVPSHDRKWSSDQELLPSVSSYGEYVTVHNVRQARYRGVDDYDVTHSHWTFSCSDVKKVWLGIEPFSKWSIFGLRPAHVFLSFQLENGTYIVVSPEIRKKEGDMFSPWKGLVRGYEIMYVVADEEDAVKLRTNHRKDTVRLYPLILSADKVQELFKNMSEKINAIHASAAFFNTALHSCTTSIVRHMRNVGIQLPQLHLLYLLPSTVDSIFYAHGLIDTKLDLQAARDYFLVTDRAQRCSDASDFSRCIRTT
ncbi:hypothetical protein CL652_02220 [bacterium]|nr:hypothetical protein [bacterium]|tara:strand:- start:8604 stop:9431 length:828 start_codon:yes stop_codon:yes gene_type:complete